MTGDRDRNTKLHKTVAGRDDDADVLFLESAGSMRQRMVGSRGG